MKQSVGTHIQERFSRLGRLSPLIIISVANAIELWARLDKPSASVTGEDYFVMFAQAAVCAVCTGILIACLCFGVPPERNEDPSSSETEGDQALETETCNLGASWRMETKNRSRSSGLKTRLRRQGGSAKFSPRSRFRWLTE